MTAKEKVLAVYPDAGVQGTFTGLYRIARTSDRVTGLSFNFVTPAEAWEDAASRLPASPVEEVAAMPTESAPKPSLRCVWCGWSTTPFESQEQYETVLWPAMRSHVINDCIDAPHMKMAARINELLAQLAAASPEPKPAMPNEGAVQFHDLPTNMQSGIVTLGAAAMPTQKAADLL